MSIDNEQTSAPNEVENTPAPSADVQESESAEASGASEATDGKDLDGKDAEGDQAEKPAEEKPKPKEGNASRKINKLKAQLSARDRELETLREQVYRKQYDQPQEQSRTVPKAEGKPNPNDFETHEEYLDARDEWRDKQRDSKSKEDQLKEEINGKMKAFQEKAKAFAQEHPDYNEVLEDLDGISLSYAVNEAVLKYGPELMYELAKDPDELARISAMHPFDAAEAIGEIRARIKSSKQEITQPKTTSAPKPPTPISAKSSAPRKTIYDKDITFAEHEKLRLAELKAKQQG